MKPERSFRRQLARRHREEARRAMLRAEVERIIARGKGGVMYTTIEIGHEHTWEFSRYCGAHICSGCGDHAHVRKDGTVSQTLARCFCGYGLQPGERLEDDVADD